MSTLEDAIKIADTKQFRTGGSNARFRDEFIRKALQSPGNFYRTYGTQVRDINAGRQSSDATQPTNTPPSTSQPHPTTTQPTQQPQAPSSSPDFSLNGGDISRGDGGGYSYGASPSSSPSSGIGSGGVFGSNPNTGAALGTVAGALGAGRASGVVGQALSGTPESQEAAAKSAAIGWGVGQLGQNLGATGLGKSALGLAAQSIARGQMPSMEDVALTAAYQTPLAPLAAMYSINRSINRGMAADHANQGRYGLATQNSWGPPTTYSTAKGWFDGSSNDMKGEDGTAMTVSPSEYGFASGVPGVNFGRAAPGMGLGRGLTASPVVDLQSALSRFYGVPADVVPSTTLQDLYGSADFGSDTLGNNNTPDWGAAMAQMDAQAQENAAQEAAAEATASQADAEQTYGVDNYGSVTGTYGGQSEVGYTDPSGGMDSGGVGGVSGADNEASHDADGNNSGDSGGDDKIVCTAMNNAYGFGSFRNAIWLAYANKHLTKYHEIGYHTLFLPLVDFGFKRGDGKLNTIVRTALEWTARHRSVDLRAEMRNKRRDPIGRVLRSVLEPLCYAVGKMKGSDMPESKDGTQSGR